MQFLKYCTQYKSKWAIKWVKDLNFLLRKRYSDLKYNNKRFL